jgi:hypothetical protein
MAGFAARAAAALRDPWSLLATAVGAGAAWAVGLPVVGIAAVGVGMIGAAAAVGGALRQDSRPEPLRVELARGTSQRALVDELETYRQELVDLQRGPLSVALQGSASDAVVAADAAASTAYRVAAALDQLDEALNRAGGVARRQPRSPEVRASIERMLRRRQELLGKLGAAVSGIGAVYTGLLELSSTAAIAGMGGEGLDEVQRVNESLAALRGAFDELERDASRLVL